MSNKIKLFVIVALLMTQISFSQKLVEVLNEVLTVNSKTALGGNTRNKTSIRLPLGTTSYIYRITISKKGDTGISSTLFSLLENLQDKRIAITAALGELAINNGENNSVDAFIFTSSYDADNFYSKNDNNWEPCQNLTSVTNSCRYVDNCMGENVYFGFQNNNLIQGIDVKLEVVALVGLKHAKHYKSTLEFIIRQNLT